MIKEHDFYSSNDIFITLYPYSPKGSWNFWNSYNKLKSRATQQNIEKVKEWHNSTKKITINIQLEKQ